MNVNNFLQSEAAQFVGTAAANTIGLVIGTIHEDIKALLQIPDEYQAIRYCIFPNRNCRTGDCDR